MRGLLRGFYAATEEAKLVFFAKLMRVATTKTLSDTVALTESPP